MSESQQALLSTSEREQLHDEISGSNTELDRDELTEQLSERLRVTLADIKTLYLALTDTELQRIFAGCDGDHPSIRATAQYTMALLYYGLTVTGDDIEYRLASAIQQAEADQGQHAKVEIDVVTEPFLPPEQRITALQEDGFERVSFEAFDRLFYDDRIPAEEFATVVSTLLDMDITPEVIRQEREGMKGLERLSTPVLTSVEAKTNNDDD